MTSKEAREFFSHTISRKQWPSVALIAVGIAVISMTRQGVRDVELAEKIIGGVGYAAAALGFLNSIRAGTTKQVDEVKQNQEKEHKQLAAHLPDDIAGKILDRLAVADYRDNENEKSVAALLGTIQHNKEACDANNRRTDELADVADDHARHIEALWIHAAAVDGTMPPGRVKRPVGAGEDASGSDGGGGCSGNDGSSEGAGE